MELLDEVDLDRESAAIILAYSLIGALVLTAGYFFLTSGPPMEIIFEEEPLEPGEVSRLQVVKGEQNVQGANISVSGVHIGETNSQGIISFEAEKANFTVKASKGNEEVSKTMNVSTTREGEINPEFGPEPEKENNETEFTGFKIEGNVTTGNTITATLYQNGERLSGLKVLVNGVNEGETTPGGSITFQVPETNELKLEAPARNISQKITVKQ
jgi:hypothetical protein